MTLLVITPRSKHLKQFRREHRHNPTPAEVAIAKLLHWEREWFSKQQCFYDTETGKCYIADFWLWKCKVIVECDGSQHYTEDGLREDKVRDDCFARSGIRTIRIVNSIAVSMNWTGLKKLLNEL